jgi:hypothetical protein
VGITITRQVFEFHTQTILVLAFRKEVLQSSVKFNRLASCIEKTDHITTTSTLKNIGFVLISLHLHYIWQKNRF